MARFGSCDRRDFLTGSALLLGSAALVGCDAAERLASPSDGGDVRFSRVGAEALYADEAGIFGLETSVVGILASDDPVGHGLAMDGIRRQRGYARQLRYGSNDRSRLPFARALIDYFLQTDGLSFRALVVQRTSQREVLYRRLIGSSRGGARPSLFLEPRTSEGGDAALAGAIDPMADVSFVDPDSKPLTLQLADVFVGSILRDVHGTRTDSYYGGIKDLIADHLRSGLGVTSLTARALASSRKFNVAA